jgi:oligoribonuclease
MIDPLLIWVDLETTGLDPTEERILEIAVATSRLSDPFTIQHVYHRVYGWNDPWDLSPHVQKMHTDNGLLEECRSAFAKGVKGATFSSSGLKKVLGEKLPLKDRPYLAGSSVHFDRGFLRETFGTHIDVFHYRHYDTSAVHMFAQSLGMPAIKKAEAHRAIADINESVAVAKTCAEWIRGSR